jgi:RNA polymerase sigma-70 factor (ECF subfamily)
MVRAIVVRRVGPNAEVEDLTQETFCRLFAGMGALQTPEAFRQVVASFALRTARWEHRQRRRHKCVTLTTTGTIPDCPVEDARSCSCDTWKG